MDRKLASENPRKMPETSVLRRYDRQTMFVASGLLICTILAAVVVAVQEAEKDAADHATEENLISDAAAVNSNPTALSHVRTGNTESTSSAMSSGQTISIDRTETGISPGKSSSPLTESPVASQTPVSALTSETYQPETQADTNPMSPVQRQDTARVIRSSIRSLGHRLHGRLRSPNSKMWLIALWHKIFARNQRPRS
jgi:hypothetical protein